MESTDQLRYPIGKYQRPEQYTTELVKGWINDISELPRELAAAIRGLDGTQLATPYRDGGWTALQVVHHLADSHMNAYIRFKLALTEDNPTIKPYKEAAWATLADSESAPREDSMDILKGLHGRMEMMLLNMSEAEWMRTYYHPEHQRQFPLWEVAGLYAWHGRHHTAHITALRERMGW